MLKLIKLEDRIVLDGAAMIEAAEQAVDAAIESGAAGLDALGDAGAEALADLALAPLQDRVDAVVDTILSPDVGEAESLVLLSRAVENFDMLREYAAVNHSVLPFDDLSAGAESRAGELVIIDPRVGGIDELVGSVPPAAQVFVLNPERDPIDQISELLAGRSDVSAIHIVAHGGAGNLALGDTLVDSDTLTARAADIDGWKQALTEKADILVYGCDVAYGDDGRAFVDQLADLTGADVAGSDDLTGDAAQGGDWDLEYSAGLVEARAAFSKAVMERYAHVLSIENPLDLNTALGAGTVRMWFDGDDASNAKTGAEEDASSLGNTYAGHYDSFTSEGSDATDGVDVNLWKDKSGNDFHAFIDDDEVTDPTANSWSAGFTGGSTLNDVLLPEYQTNVAKLNGRSALYFDGTDYLSVLQHTNLAESSRSKLDASTNEFMDFNDFSVFSVVVADGGTNSNQDTRGNIMAASEGGGDGGRMYLRYEDNSGTATDRFVSYIGDSSPAGGLRVENIDTGLFSTPTTSTLYTSTFNTTNDDVPGGSTYYETKLYMSGGFADGGQFDKANEEVDHITIGANKNTSMANPGSMFHGYIAEIIVLDHDATENSISLSSDTITAAENGTTTIDSSLSLTEGERFQVEAYLAAKWDTGLEVMTIELDGQHASDDLTWSTAVLDSINAGHDTLGDRRLEVTKTTGVGGDTTLTLTSTSSTTGAVDDTHQLTVDDVQTFLRTVRMIAGDAGADRTITYTWAGYGGAGTEAEGGQDVVTVEVAAAVAPAFIDMDSGTVEFTEGNGPVALDPEHDASITDNDPSLGVGGTLTVDLATAGTVDLSNFTVGLDAETSGTVSINGSNEVVVNGSTVGTVSNGLSGGDFNIVWNADATEARVAEVLRALSIDSDLELMEDDITASISTSDTDGTPSSNTAVMVIDLVEQNDAPEIDGATSVTGPENDGVTIPSLSISDVDYGTGAAGNMTATLAVDRGSLNIDVTNTGAGIASSSATEVVVTGTLDELNDLLDATGDGSVIYFGEDDPSVTAQLTLTVDDGSNTSEPGDPADPQTAVHNMAITVTAQNDAPEATVASGIVMNENTPLPLDGGGYLTISDPDAGSGDVSVVVSVAEGTISAVLGDSAMDAPVNNESAVTLVGTVQEIQDFLDGNTSGSLTYFAPDDPPSATSVTLFIDDQGNSPSGALTAQDTGTISINAQDDPPILLLDPLESDGTVGTVDFTTAAYGAFESVALLSSSGTADNILRPDGDGEIQDVTIEYGIDAIGGIRDSSGNKEQFIIDNGAGSTMTIDLAAGTTTGASTLAFGGTDFTVSAP
ncbi:MAG: DUF4347 domain-containing protein, partial [Gammaproteobacteria bacterium]